MNGSNNTDSNGCINTNVSTDSIDLRKENTEFERRRKLVEEAKKLILSVQKV